VCRTSRSVRRTPRPSCSTGDARLAIPAPGWETI
jgi:hypothetical protein